AEVSIVGFDDLEIAELVSPPLTTVNVPAKQMGIMAGKALSGDSKPVKSLIVHEMQTRLIVRGSTGQAST
ncbi:substrate-binding domain-containing protein, partial [Limimaricola cinnabarinus]